MASETLRTACTGLCVWDAAWQLPGHRAAPGQAPQSPAHLCTLDPPYPPSAKLPPTTGETRRTGGVTIAFLESRRHRHSLKPVDWYLCYLVSPDSSKASAEFATFQPPQVDSFFPRVASFLPQAAFAQIGLFLPLSLSLSEEEEEGRKEGRRAGPIHRFSSCLKKHPRVRTPIHGFSVDDFLSETQCWRGFTVDQTSIHASTGRNAPLPPSELGHGC